MDVFERKFDLLENARNFIEESIYDVERAKEKPSKWPFAILHIIQGLELLIKHLLVIHHKILVYEDIDKPKNTVSLQQGLNRLIALDSVSIEEKEKQAITKAITFRNNIVHYEYDLNAKHAEAIYCELFEFIHFFYQKHIKSELKDIIDKDLWHAEAELLSKFKTRFITYHGETMDRKHPLSIMENQLYNAYVVGDKTFKRVAYGTETTCVISTGNTCGDCGVKKGMYHTEGCDNEQCPICGWQVISCNCEIEALQGVEEYEVD